MIVTTWSYLLLDLIIALLLAGCAVPHDTETADHPRISIDLATEQLSLFCDQELLKQYTIGIGKEARTPVGTYAVSGKQVEPVWWDAQGNEIPYGHTNNVLGACWIGLRAAGDTPDITGYGIHGGWDGKRRTMGCIAMRDRDVRELFDLVPQDTPVIVRGKSGTRMPSPDGKCYAVVRTHNAHLPLGDRNVTSTHRNPYGHIWIVSGNAVTTDVRWVQESRGVEFELDPVRAFCGSLVPRNLQWDSTGRFLYYEFGGGPSASGVWRVDREGGVPRYVSSTRERFRLLPQPEGPDWVVCSQVRDGKWLWFVYTPDDIARDKHAFSTNEVFVEETAAP